MKTIMLSQERYLQKTTKKSDIQVLLCFVRPPKTEPTNRRIKKKTSLNET